MSRASDCRDAIVTAIAEILGTTVKVEAFSELPHSRDELREKPIALVRLVDREIEVDQGPDSRYLTMQVGLCSLKPAKENYTPQSYRAELVSAADSFDTIFEQVIAAWTPDGPLVSKAMADHRFDTIEEVITFEFNTLHNQGIYLSLLTLRYIDLLDT